MALIRFLPGFVRSKAFWVEDVQYILKNIPMKERHIVELFSGSAVISGNCAGSATLIDTDEVLCEILSRYDDQRVPEEFTSEMYFKYREEKDWWRYAFCLQKMAFSSIFRYSKSGFNVPKRSNLESIHVLPEYKKALSRWKKLQPVVLNQSYLELAPESFQGKILVADPPYEGSQASYNKKSFDYDTYWNYVDSLRYYARLVILFDRRENILKHFSINDISFYKQKTIRVNGKYEGDSDCMISLTTLK